MTNMQPLPPCQPCRNISTLYKHERTLGRNSHSGMKVGKSLAKESSGSSSGCLYRRNYLNEINMRNYVCVRVTVVFSEHSHISWCLCSHLESPLPAIKSSAELHITRAEKTPQNPRGYSIAKGIFRNQCGIKIHGRLDVLRTQLSLR